VYYNILPHIRKRSGGENGAEILGVHVEGPFICKEKKGAHPSQFILNLDDGFKTLQVSI
jgi:N-acetylglucosamine-6-phosphate deacetylase